MCLIVDNEKFREFYENWYYKKDHIYVYKLANQISETEFQSPWQGTRFNLGEIFKADGQPVYSTTYNGVMLEGGAIHCAFEPNDILQFSYACRFKNNLVILKCQIEIANVIAIGQFDLPRHPYSIALSEIKPLEVINSSDVKFNS